MERVDPTTAAVSSAATQEKPAGISIQMTGSLRSDIQFIPPGEHGSQPMIFDPVAENYFKLSEESCKILRLLDQSYQLPDFMQRLKQNGMDADPQEVLELLSFMHQNQLMVPEYGGMNSRLEKMRKMKEKTRFTRFISMYMFFRLPPIHPDGFFSVAMPFVRFIFNRWTVWFLVFLAACGYILMLRQWTEAYATFVNSLSWANLVNYFWALLITKSVHELSHGFTAKSFGARIRSMGISFIVFYPRLFVDLTDTWRLSRWKRTLCDGAGIISELIFGGIAAIIWAYAQPGPMRSTMFYLMTVSALGTILVNGNPFIRYDGYYLLCDMLNIENLMQRSNEFLKACNRRFFLGLGRVPDSGDVSPLTLYFFGLGSFIYKLFLYTSIILIIYFQFTKAVAIFLMVLEAYTMLIMPFIMEVKIVLMNHKKLNGMKSLATGILVLALLSLLFIPLPWSFALPCEIVPENSRLIIVKEAAFAAEDLSEEPRRIKKGDTILKFENVFLDFNILRYAAILKTNQAELELARSDNRTLALSPVYFEKLRVNRISHSEMIRRRGNMDLKADADGIFVPAVKEVYRGRWLEKGTVLGRISSEENTVYAYALDREVNRIQIGDSVQLVLRGELTKTRGRVTAVNPVAVTLRDSALVQHLGGTVPCYPVKERPDEFSPVNVLYCVTVTPEKPLSKRVGRTGIAYVKQSYILAVELGRQLLHIFFREFSF